MEREQTTIRLPAELKEQLQQEAEQIGISFNAYILMLIDKGHRD
jgi:predicted DNA-binding protein